MDVDPLLALSLARTALDDPAALPEAEESRIRALGSTSFRGSPVDLSHAAYAVERIDAALAVLRFDPVDDPGLEAHAILSTLRALVVSVAYDLDAVSGVNLAALHVKRAAACLADAMGVVAT